jgi:Uma2 family endonuclease
LNIWLTRVLGEFVEHHDLGQVRGPQTQIRIGPKRQRREPDVLFVSQSRRDVIRTNHIEGPPDLIIELVSPDSITRDWRDKYQAYEAAGVREYWVIDRNAQRMDAYQLGPGGYALIDEKDGTVRSGVIAGFYLRPAWLWQDPLPKVADVMRELGVRI